MPTMLLYCGYSESSTFQLSILYYKQISLGRSLVANGLLAMLTTTYRRNQKFLR